MRLLVLLLAALLVSCGGGGGGAGPVADTQAPSITLAASANLFNSPGRLQLSASASDNVGVTSIEFYDGAMRVAADVTDPTRASIDLDAPDNGLHAYTAVARDAAGNHTITVAVNVSVNIPVTQPSQRQVRSSALSLDGFTTVWYWEYLPAGHYSSNTIYPLLVFLHGSGESGPPDGSQLAKVKAHGPPKLIQANHDMCFDTPTGRECFIVVSPQNGRGWWDNRDTAAIVAHAMQAYHVDPKRVYVTGLSMGGGATWTLATAIEDGSNPSSYWAARFAAIAPICGAAESRFAHAGICQFGR